MVANQFLIKTNFETTVLERYSTINGVGRCTQTDFTSWKNIFLKYTFEVPVWVSGTAYQVNSFVVYNNIVYQRNVITNNTLVPDVSPTEWRVSNNELTWKSNNTFSQINVGNQTLVSVTERTKTVYFEAIQAINRLYLRYPTASDNPFNQRIQMFKNLQTLGIDQGANFNWSSLPVLTTITQPISLNTGDPALIQNYYLDLSQCKNLLFINIFFPYITSNSHNIYNFQLPTTTNKLKMFRIYSLHSSNSVFNMIGVTAFDFSNFTELEEMTYVFVESSTVVPSSVALTQFTPPTSSKLQIYRVSKSTFTSLDLTASASTLKTFQFYNNPNITTINLTGCTSIQTFSLGFGSGLTVISSTPALTTLNLPSIMNSCTSFKLASSTALSGTLSLPSMTSLTTGYFFNNGYSTITFNSNTSSNSDLSYYNNSALTTINNFPNNAKTIYLDTCNNLSATNSSLFSTILSLDRTKLIIVSCSSFTFTNPDLSLLTSCTEYRSDGVPISGAFTLPPSNTMTRFSASNITSINRFSTSLISLYITTSSTLTDANFCNAQSPKIPATVACLVINNTLLDSSINDISHLTASNFNIYLNNNNLTSFTFPSSAKNFNTNLQSRPIDSQNTNVNIGAGINLSNNPNLTSLTNLVGINHNFSPLSTNAGVFNVSNTALNMEFPFGKVNNTNLRPHFISLNSMTSMSLLNLYLSLKNIYDNKTAWSDYNAGNGSAIVKTCNMSNTVITTKTALQPSGYVLKSSDGTIITPTTDAERIQAMREMKFVMENQEPASTTTKKYRWLITL